MPITTECPHCGKSIRAADTAAGKKVKCPECQEAFRVTARPPDDEEERIPAAKPAKRRADDEGEPVPERPRSRPADRADAKDTATRRKRDASAEGRRRPVRAAGGKGIPVWVIVGGAAVLLLLVGGGIGGFLLLRDRGKESPAGPNNPQPPAPRVQLPTPVAEWTDKDPVETPAPGANGLHIIYRGKLVKVVPLNEPIREKSIEFWFTIADVNQQRTTLAMVDDGVETWDGIVYGESPRQWFPGSSFRDRSGSLNGPVEAAKPTDLVHLVMVYSVNGAITLYRNGSLYGVTVPRGNAKVSLRSYPAESTTFRIGASRENDGGGAWNGAFQGDIKAARLYNRALSNTDVMALFNDGKARLSGLPGGTVPPGSVVPPDGQRPPGNKPGPTTTPPGTPTIVLKASKTFLTDSNQRGPQLSLSRDGSQAVTVIEGGHLWDTAGGKELPWNDPEIAKGMKENVHTAVYSSDGAHLWTSLPRRIVEFNAKTHTIERSISTEESGRWSLSLSADQKYIATEEEVYDVQAKHKTIDFTKELGSQVDVTFGHDGKTVVARGMAGLTGFQGISLWSLNSAKVVHKIEFKGDALLESQFVACSPTSDVFAMRTRTGDGEVVEIRDLATGEVKATFGKGLKLVAGSLAWSPNGKYLSVTVDLGFVDHGFRRAVWLLDATTGKPVASLSPAPGQIDRVAFSGDGTRFAVLSPNSNQGGKMDLILWDMTPLPK